MNTQAIIPGDRWDYRVAWRGEAPGPWLAPGDGIEACEASAAGPLTVTESAIDGDDVVVWVQADADAQPRQQGWVSVRISTSSVPSRIKTVVIPFVIVSGR